MYSIRRPGSVLTILHQSSKDITVKVRGESVINYSVGEHAAAFLREDDGGLRWYLGIVNELSKNKDKINCKYHITKGGINLEHV